VVAVDSAARRAEGGDIVNRHNRIQEIVKSLRHRSVISIKDLTKRFGVSEMTIRRDLNLLEKESVIELIPGGAVLKTSADEDTKYLVAEEESVRAIEKLKIGQKAVTYIGPNETIILDIGTTTEYIAKFIRDDLPLTVLAFTVNSLFEIYKKESCRVILAGGYYHPETMTFASPEGIELIKRTRADRAFVSAAGIHLELGVTTVYPHELDIKKAILRSAQNRILVVDSSKFGKTKSVYFADLADFQVVITDAGIPGEYVQHLDELGVKVVIV
jgi:DeoR family deoxyribose operon repressor